MINLKFLWRSNMVISTVLLFGCNTATSPNAPNTDQRCKLETFQKLLWRPEAALAGMDLKGVRVIQPNSAVTMDYRPNRTNVVIGNSGRIERVYCG